MPSLFEFAELFEASTRLEYAAQSVCQLIDGISLSDEDKSSLNWAGQLLERVDWYESKWASAHVTADLAVQATSVRPIFYSTLTKTFRKIQESEENEEEIRRNFLRYLHHLLNKSDKSEEIPKEYLRFSADFLHLLSRSLLLQVGHNGHSEPKPSLAFGF